MRRAVVLLLALGVAAALPRNVTKIHGACSRVGERALSHAEKCDVAQSTDCGNKYVAAYYCARSAGARGFFCVFCLGWLALLFVLLGSTADEYFSPALEQFSADAGLPPRFAGVTLLALGNGAPDVSSTMRAVQMGQYRLSLGALTGAGMFVGTVVTGAVVMRNELETRAKGALIRDVSAYALTACLVVAILAHGRVDYGLVALLLSCYAAFVLIVLAADLWHRRPGGPYEADQAQRQSDDEPPAIELLLTLLHSVRRPDHHHHQHHHHRGAASNVVSPAAADDDSRLQVDAGEIQLRTARRSPYVVIDGDDTTNPLDLGGAFETGFGAAPLTESLLLDDMPVAEPARTCLGDLAQRCHRHVADAVVDEPSVLWKVFGALELPFVALRRGTVPLTAEDSYARGPLILSVVGAPVWLAVYFFAGGDHPARFESILAAALCVGALAGALVAHLTAGGYPLAKPAAYALALFGFVCAAMWIDVFAGELVAILEFFGVLAAIPEPVLGLTVLAWGNSVGDFSTNLSMAKKGLANMAITACFAGPVFNMLVGLGLGIAMWLREAHAESLPVKLNTGLYLGFSALILNCVAVVVTGIANGNVIPRNFAFFSITLYALYIVLSLALLFTAAK